MSDADLAAATGIANRVHVNHPEDAAVFAERLKLYPAGCWVLGQGDNIAGYIVSHPWRLGEPPALNSLLRQLPADASTYYIHDLTLLPAARGTKAASGIVRQILAHAVARGFANASLVAVTGSAPFWQAHGFRIIGLDDAEMRRKLASYGGDARFMVRDLGGQ
ncbi:MAG: GCN5-related N-acetyltransferase [Xanthobacteraceae bacterium]|nr:GCN5-related N-acetyltransferase [Xanthobacteraceae bacterium]